MGGELGVDAQAAGGVIVARVSALFLRPTHERRGPGGPALGLGALRAGILLVAQVQEANVAQELRAEATDLDVILQHGERLADLVSAGGEELSLELEARPPGQVAADV